MSDLDDIGWCVLDLLMAARRSGAVWVNRMELLGNERIPSGLRVKLVFRALLMANGEFVRMHGEHDFEITERGAEVFELRFGKSASGIPEGMLALPGKTSHRIQ